MRLLTCCTILMICLSIIPTIHCDNYKNNKLMEFDENDKRQTKKRYTKREIDENQRFKKNFKRMDDDDDDADDDDGDNDCKGKNCFKKDNKLTSFKKNNKKDDDDDEEDLQKNLKNIGKFVKNGATEIKQKLKKLLKHKDNDDDDDNDDSIERNLNKSKRRTKIREEIDDDSDDEDSDEDDDDDDDDDESDEVQTSKIKFRGNLRYKKHHDDDDDSDEVKPEKSLKFKSKKIVQSEDKDNEICVNKRGRNCRNNDDNSDEDSGEDSDEDDDDDDKDGYDKRKRTRTTYVKKFAHEKKKSARDLELSTVLKIHKDKDLKKEATSMKTRNKDDDDSSEEESLPKRHRFIHDDDDE